MNGNLVTTFINFENECMGRDTVDVDVLRDGKMLKLTVEIDRLWGGCETSQVVHWSGALLQTPHRAVKQQSTCPSEIYCSWWSHGSPAEKYGLHATIFITEVNDVVVKTIDDFLSVISQLDTKEFIRLRAINLNNKESVLTMLVDYQYWPTWVISRKDRKWVSEDLAYMHMKTDSST